MIARLNRFYTKNLNSDFCLRCGNKKSKGFSFCSDCIRQLPRVIKTGLYLPIEHGYKEHFELALEFLNKNGHLGYVLSSRRTKRALERIKKEILNV